MYDKLQCPNCGAAMEERGPGRHLCNSCHYELDENGPTEEEKAAAEAAAKPKYSGPGFKEPWGSSPVVGAPENSGTMAAPAKDKSPMDSVHKRGTAPILVENPEDRYPTLASEKSWYYKIALFFYFLNLIGCLFSGPRGWLEALVITVFIAALYYFLYEAPSWGKWLCFFWQLISIVSPILLFISLSVGNLVALKQFKFAMVFSNLGTALMIFVLTAGWSIWLMTIMWRDIQIIRMQRDGSPEFMG